MTNSDQTGEWLDEFTALVCADPVLLRAEFDDIIAAEFPAHGTPRHQPVIRADQPPDQPRRPPGRYRDAPESPQHRAGTKSQSCQRSPPPPTGQRPHPGMNRRTIPPQKTTT